MRTGKAPNDYALDKAKEILEELRQRAGERDRPRARTRLYRPAAEAVLRMSQQDQALNYFRRYADDWQRKAVNVESEYGTIEARNGAVLATIDAMGDARRLLDVGCGTGQLVVEAAAAGSRRTASTSRARDRAMRSE